MANKLNAVMTETADEILGKHRRKTQTWVTDEILEMCDKRRDLKKKNRDTTIGAAAYKGCNKKIRKDMDKAPKKTGLRNGAPTLKTCSLNKNNSR